jgi:hypothetical protein
MRRLLSRRPSPAMVVACIALIVALGGTGYAAIKLPRNSVGAKQLRANAVTSGKVRNGTLTAKDFQASALNRGPRGPQGPKGDSAPGAIPRVAFASRDPVAGSGAALPVGAAFADYIGLDVGAGSAGYVSSSGRVVATGPSRLIANGEAVITNNSGAAADVSCRLTVVAAETRAIGSYANGSIANGGYIPVSVSAGTDVEAGTYDVRLQCSSPAAAIQFHRGNLTVAIAPR